MLHKSIVWAATTLLVAALPVSAYAAIYNFTSFDGPGNNGGGTTVNGINNAGDVVGFSSDNAANPTLFTNFIRNANGTFTAFPIGGDPLAMANGINDSRALVGSFSNGSAFIMPSGSPVPLATVNGTTVSQAAFGTNNAGTVVGQYVDSATGTSPGFLFNGTYTTLSPSPVAIATNARGVNNLGLVTGFWSADGIHQHGFLYNSTTQQYTFLADPNVPNLLTTEFLGINDTGLTVGYYETADGSQHGFLYDIASQSYTFLDDPFAATSGPSVTEITGVNNSDEITGFYIDGAGLQRGFIATAAVPEPSTWAMMLIGFAGLGFMVSRRRSKSVAGRI